MAIFKNRQSDEKREISLNLEELAKQCGSPVPFEEIDLQAVLGIQSVADVEARRLKDGKIVVEGPRWDLFLNEAESKEVVLEGEEAEAALQREAEAHKTLARMTADPHLSVKDAIATDLHGNPLTVLVMVASRAMRLDDIPTRIQVPAKAVLVILTALEDRGLITINTH